MSEQTYVAVLLLTLVAISLNVGVFSLYAHTLMPGLKRLDDAAFVKSFQSIDRSIVNPIFMVQFFLPIPLIAAIYLQAASRGYEEAGYLLLGGIAYLAAVVLTVAINVPLNDGIKKVASSSTEQQFSQARAKFSEARWSSANLLRTGLTVVAVICTGLAVYIHG